MFCSGQVYTPEVIYGSTLDPVSAFTLDEVQYSCSNNVSCFVSFERTRNTFEVGISACLASDVTLLPLEEHHGTHSSIRILHWHVWLTNLVAGSSLVVSSLKDGAATARSVSTLPRWDETAVRLRGAGLALRPAQQFRCARRSWERPKHGQCVY